MPTRQRLRLGLLDLALCCVLGAGAWAIVWNPGPVSSSGDRSHPPTPSRDQAGARSESSQASKPSFGASAPLPNDGVIDFHFDDVKIGTSAGLYIDEFTRFEIRPRVRIPPGRDIHGVYYRVASADAPRKTLWMLYTPGERVRRRKPLITYRRNPGPISAGAPIDLEITAQVDAPGDFVDPRAGNVFVVRNLRWRDGGNPHKITPSSPTPSASPTPVPTPSPLPTSTPSPTPTPAATASPTATPSPTPSPTPAATPTVVPLGKQNGAIAHLFVADDYEGALTLEAFKRDVDALAEAGLQSVATSLRTWEVTSFVENDDGLVREEMLGVPKMVTRADPMSRYEEALSYAKDKGLNVILHVSPLWHPDLTVEDYKFVTWRTFKFATERLGEYVDIWALWNEPDLFDFRSFKPIDWPVDEYLGRYRAVLEIAHEQIDQHARSRRSMITVGGSFGRGARAETLSRWHQVVGSMPRWITDIGVHVYTDGDNIGAARKLNQFIATYDDPVHIDEFGVCLVKETRTEATKRALLLETTRLLNEEVNHYGLRLYRMTDERPEVLGEEERGCENSFGIRAPDGTERSYFDEVLEALASSEE